MTTFRSGDSWIIGSQVLVSKTEDMRDPTIKRVSAYVW